MANPDPNTPPTEPPPTELPTTEPGEAGLPVSAGVYLTMPESPRKAEEYTRTLFPVGEAFQQRYHEVDDAIRKGDLEHLRHILPTPAVRQEPMNLSGDPLLSVVIANGRSPMALELIKEMVRLDQQLIMAQNFDGDSALHVAAAKGDMAVAEALVSGSNGELLRATNSRKETPMHKAALFGEQDVFWRLADLGGDLAEVHKRARRGDGATMLHCAIMGNAPELALEIATRIPQLRDSRNDEAVTPLQLIVTIPDMFRSQQQLGVLKSLLYECIPVEEKQVHKNSDKSSKPAGDIKDEESLQFFRRSWRNIPPNCATLFGLLEWACTPVKWIGLLVFNMARQLSTTIRGLESQKKHHKCALKLVAELAKDPKYWDFITKGRSGSPSTLPNTEPKAQHENEKGGDKLQIPLNAKEYVKRSLESCKEDADVKQIFEACKAYARSHDTKDEKKTRWNDSPLILGAKMGHHEFVKQILQVCPVSAHYLDMDGKNFLQVAIEEGREKIVEIVEKMAFGDNPKLPRQLLSRTHEKTKSTILHFAAELTVQEAEAAALQIQYELQWFERVRRLTPNDLIHSRNHSDKTAKELFAERHKDMVKNAKDYLMDVGKTCSGLVAAVVFASSFSIPGQGQSNNPEFLGKTAFKIFSNAYVFGLSCAATALVLFLSLLTSPYREQDFRRSLPMKYFFALVSFLLALVSLLVAFSCNIYLTIYGERKAQPKGIVPFVCELTIFPAACFLVLLYWGCDFGVGSFFRRVWR